MRYLLLSGLVVLGSDFGWMDGVLIAQVKCWQVRQTDNADVHLYTGQGHVEHMVCVVTNKVKVSCT